MEANSRDGTGTAVRGAAAAAIAHDLECYISRLYQDEISCCWKKRCYAFLQLEIVKFDLS